MIVNQYARRDCQRKKELGGFAFDRFQIRRERRLWNEEAVEIRIAFQLRELRALCGVEAGESFELDERARADVGFRPRHYFVSSIRAIFCCI